MHILSPETDNCPSWISGRERMTVENISWSTSAKECCLPRRGLNPRPPGLQSDSASNWATEAGHFWWTLHQTQISFSTAELCHKTHKKVQKQYKFQSSASSKNNQVLSELWCKPVFHLFCRRFYQPFLLQWSMTACIQMANFMSYT